MRPTVVAAGSPGSGANSVPMSDAEPRMAGEEAGAGATHGVPDAGMTAALHAAGEHASEPALMLGGMLFAVLALGVALVALAAYLFV